MSLVEAAAAVVLLMTAACYGLFFLIANWLAERTMKRLLDRIRHPEKYAGDSPRRPLIPESLVVVRLSDTEVVCERPDGKTERITWENLRAVDILTTSDGPFAPDVFWLLTGAAGGCAVPQGATGHEELLARLQTLPGFRNEAVVRAMGSTSEACFPCWQRPPLPAGNVG